jgi:DNA-binding transcriptional ArsR family regulator
MAFGDVGFDDLVKALSTPTVTLAPEAKKTGGKELRKAIIMHLAGKPAVAFQDLCKTVGSDVSEQNVRYHLKALMECGAIEAVDRGFYALTKAFTE